MAWNCPSYVSMADRLEAWDLHYARLDQAIERQRAQDRQREIERREAAIVFEKKRKLEKWAKAEFEIAISITISRLLNIQCKH